MTKIDNNYKSSNINKSEFLILGIILAVALSGIIIMLSSWNNTQTSSSTPSSNYQQFPSQIEATKVSKTTSTLPTEKINVSKNFWTIDKFPEVGEVTHFNIEDYDESVQYSIDIGDGKFKALRGNAFQHVYTEAGSYTVSLRVAYGKHKRTLKQQIDVAQSIEILASLEQ